MDRGEIEAEVRRELAANLASGLMQLITGEKAVETPVAEQTSEGTETEPSSNGAASEDGQYMAPWIDTDKCTSCDECIKLNANLFAYNDQKKATIKDPLGGPYKDLVKAAERCTARVIHPGLPKDRSEKDIAKWIKRAEKFNQ